MSIRNHVIVGVFIMLLAGSALAQSRLRLIPVSGTSMIKLRLGTRSAKIDLDGNIDGSYGSMPGDPPHTFNVLFTTSSKGFFYMVAKVRSRSPISDKNAPCGGDAPQSILWIGVARNLKNPKLQNEVFESCSFNYYDSKVRRDKNELVIDFGASEKRRMTYDNRHPEKGLEIMPVK